MSEQEIIAEIVEVGGVEVGTDLVPVPQGNLFGTEDPVTIIEKATMIIACPRSTPAHCTHSATRLPAPRPKPSPRSWMP